MLVAINESLLNKLLRLETLQHRQRLNHIRQQCNELEKYRRLATSLDQLACDAVVKTGATSSMQLGNRGNFHTQLLTMEQSCQRAVAMRAASVRSLAEVAMVKMQRLKRIRQRLSKSS